MISAPQHLFLCPTVFLRVILSGRYCPPIGSSENISEKCLRNDYTVYNIHIVFLCGVDFLSVLFILVLRSQNSAF